MTSGRRRRIWIGTYPAAGQTAPTGQGEGIWQVSLDVATGELVEVKQVAVTAAPSYLATGTSGAFLYAVNEEVAGGLSAFRVHSDSLEQVAWASTAGVHPCHLRLHSRLSALLVANYTSGSVAMFRLNPQGLLESAEPSQLLEFHGAGPNSARQESSHAHYLLETASEVHVLVSDLGADCLRRLKADPETSRFLDDGIAVKMSAGSGPRHAVFGPDRQRLYVVGELDGQIHTVAWDQASSTGEVISSCPADPTHEGDTHLSHIVRIGQELVVGSRGQDLLAVHTLGPDGSVKYDRKLRLPGDWPRHHADIDGWLVVAQQNGGGVITLDRSGTPRGFADIPSPACILPAAFHPDGRGDSEQQSQERPPWLGAGGCPRRASP